jgi:dynein heavy chain
MARFGAGINEIKTFSIEITKSYKSKEFHEDIKMLLQQCGVEGKEMQFLFSDTQIV